MAYSAGFGRKQTQIEYVVQRIAGTAFKVKKLADGEQLLETYEVDLTQMMKDKKGNPLARCTCMAWRSGKTRPCKHIQIVAAFLYQGEPAGHTYPDPRSKL